MKMFKRFWHWLAGQEPNSQPTARIVEASITPKGAKIYTFVLTYPRFIHGEFMTHRVFSRNAMSSRAVPVAKMLKQVWNDPAMPIHWGRNQPGMQAHSELGTAGKWLARFIWKMAGRCICIPVWLMNKLGVHKQIANRLLEPWQRMVVVMTATEFDNFFELRMHPDAQPEFQALATVMADAMLNCDMRQLTVDSGTHTDWHLPFVLDEERGKYPLNLLLKLSGARSARVSFLNHDGTKPDPLKDESLFDRLVGSKPLHASPIEHQASSANDVSLRSGNFVGFHQFRQLYAAPNKRR